MSVEHAWLLVFSVSAWEAGLSGACRHADIAFRRQQKAQLGDDTEAVRYAQICEDIRVLSSQLPALHRVRLAAASIAALDQAGPHHPWCLSEDVERHPFAMVPEARLAGHGQVLYEVRHPFAFGPTPSQEAGELREPSGTWRPGGYGDEVPRGMMRSEAQTHLWNEQLDRAAAGNDVPLVPDGIVNSVLTEGLRRYADGEGRPNVRARVLYRDGSEARPVPLGALRMLGGLPDDWLQLRLASMSMRHPEMDTDVDGALLRNRVISRHRPSADTDEVAYQQTLRRLAAFTKHGPVCLHIYQAGFEPAILGIYRAVLEHLTHRPQTLAVCTHYYRGPEDYEAGTVWRAQ